MDLARHNSAVDTRPFADKGKLIRDSLLQSKLDVLTLTHSYWGIFWINASSDELAKQTFQDIAKIGGVADNMSAAKHWLSNLKYRWLLIIDNADNSQVKLDHYFPEGERGHILLTTRIPGHRDYGTVGSQFFHFEGLDPNDGNDLLLKAASKPLPPDSITE